MRSDIVDITVRIIKRTEMAVLVRTESDTKVWLPLSEIEIHPPEGSRLSQDISLPEWMALQKELI